ncbi:MFS transporter [Oricola cellulosilytica]|uniref:MFS transporter n=1 Tax=Oricola cellulosilytica TaxID=1429082 RepID=A0A4R0PBP7_9HYPH|nr:MFS transporter [Oricola cellulosilytica]TCD13842.1 MFS transporter [Oricola cellulosilytica]
MKTTETIGAAADAAGPLRNAHPRRIRQARWAVSAAFFANGFVVGHWAPKIPVLAARLGITESVLGALVIMFGLGALISLLAGAVLTTRYGSDRIVRWTSLMLAPALLLISLSPSLAMTALTMLWLGIFLGAMDGAMNANAVSVEKARGHAIMSSCHGFWSLGGLTGAPLGGWMLVRFGDIGHSVGVLVLTGIIVLAAQYYYLRDAKVMAIGDEADSDGWSLGKVLALLPTGAGIYILGLCAFLSFVPEGSILDWSALYLAQEHKADIAYAGYAFAAFSGTMALMRFLGDGLRERLGDARTFLISSLIASVGFAIAGLGAALPVVIGGFLVCGVGLANMVPIVFSAAGRFKGVEPAIGIGIVTAFGYSGALTAPAVLGFVAERTGLAIIFAAFAVILLATGLLSLSLRSLRE